MKKYIYLLLILFISSLNFNLILKPLNLVTGGTPGLAIILSSLLNISPSFIILIINIIMLILSFIYLSKKSTIGTIVATFAYPFFIKLTSFINFNFDIPLLILIIISGIICGFTCGYIYKLGYASGGINIISLILNKKYNINIAKTNFIINFIIILTGGIKFGFIKCFYSLIIVIINSYIINKVLKKDITNISYKKNITSIPTIKQ